MVELILFFCAALFAIYVVTYILTYAGWYLGYQMIVTGLVVFGMAYFVFGEFPHVYLIVVGQMFINGMVVSFNRTIRGCKN